MNKKEKAQIKLMFKVVGIRFLKVFVSTALVTMATLTINQETSWLDLLTSLNAVVMISCFSAINGTLVAVDKLLRFK
jgi:hypothetical protein